MPVIPHDPISVAHTARLAQLSRIEMADRARAAVATWRGRLTGHVVGPLCLDTDVRDLLTDLMHLSQQIGLTFEAELLAARMNFEAELQDSEVV